MEKLQHIQDITDSRGNVHSVLIYGKGDLRLGNKNFTSMKWVKYYIEEAYGVKVQSCEWCEAPTPFEQISDGLCISCQEGLGEYEQ